MDEIQALRELMKEQAKKIQSLETKIALAMDFLCRGLDAIAKIEEKEILDDKSRGDAHRTSSTLR